jgi:putative endonuclease
MPTYYVYILANMTGTLYVGVTSNLEGRMLQHKSHAIEGFTKKYKVDKLMYYEEFQYIEDAIRREKQIKGYRRNKKRALVESQNPKWEDLSEGWFDDPKSLQHP